MFQNILCATDLNSTTHIAVKKAVQLAHQFNSKVYMLNVHDEFMSKDEMAMLRVSIEKMQTIFKETAVEAKKDMQQLVKRFNAEDIEIEYLIKDGKCCEVICEITKNNNIDLIIMGVSEKNIITNVIFKSTASMVIERIDVPVLVVPNNNN